MVSDEAISRAGHPFQNLIVGEFQKICIECVVERLKEGETFLYLQGDSFVFSRTVDLIDQDRFEIKAC